ncbi:uncharacterized protein LOC9658177 [Selaginella moellendorffii]|uniref:uncharacterized protein LOC9658177 n=1 Tax=Selaginella moellendorffii TaxID=88036 RepID=UPI000D1CB3B8|nr:uncharacterized protein LOC9658177 [Selaginella moellendorffii]|eukprot:XP_024539006.1 uncharacterized protein LOC9658177 [Selaginella moellendorffii]
MGRCRQGGSIGQGSWYWIRDKKSRGAGDSSGLVVMMAWMFSNKRYHMPYVHLFNEIGWECLVCQAHFLNLWFPTRALAIAVKILDELVEELSKRPRPVTFTSFSGGMKACTYMIIQILQGKRPQGFTGDMEKYKIVRDCTAGYIFDSTPINFVSETGIRFARRMLGTSVGNNFAVKFGLEKSGRALESMFSSNFEQQGVELNDSFYAAVEMAPALFLCSRNDDLAPFDVIEKFVSEVQGQTFKKVTLVHWEESDHVAHLRHHTEDYKRAVSKFLCEVSGGSMEQTKGLMAQEQIEEVKQHHLEERTVKKLEDVASMIVEDVFDLQHDFKDDSAVKKRIILTFPVMRSRL